MAREDLVKSNLQHPTNNKYEFVIPIGLPEQGCFDWVDSFLARFPGKYLEISDRSLHAWIERSGIRQKENVRKKSKDKYTYTCVFFIIKGVLCRFQIRFRNVSVFVIRIFRFLFFKLNE